MKVLRKAKELPLLVDDRSLGFVATMGALHEGHASLIESSKAQNEKTIVSIFVNPTQFNKAQDFETYPDVLSDDLELCKKMKVDYVFVPVVEEIYKPDESIKLVENAISEKYEGEHRPGHFSGVLAVVLKLLNLINPDRAYFGKKDYQQYILIKRLAENFFLKSEIIGVETARDACGLALSSRNLNLTAEGLVRAQSIAAAFLASDSKQDFLNRSEKFDLNLEYYAEDWNRALMAHFVDGVRLIDNKPLRGQ